MEFESPGLEHSSGMSQVYHRFILRHLSKSRKGISGVSWVFQRYFEGVSLIYLGNMSGISHDINLRHSGTPEHYKRELGY